MNAMAIFNLLFSVDKLGGHLIFSTSLNNVTKYVNPYYIEYNMTRHYRQYFVRY